MKQVVLILVRQDVRKVVMTYNMHMGDKNAIQHFTCRNAKRTYGRATHWWGDNIKMNSKESWQWMNWIQMDQGQWWSCLNKIMNLAFYKMQGTLTSWATKFAQWRHLVTTERLCPINDMKYLRLCSKGSRKRRNIHNFVQMQQNNFFFLSEHCPSIFLVEASWNVMAHA